MQVEYSGEKERWECEVILAEVGEEGEGCLVWDCSLLESLSSFHAEADYILLLWLQCSQWSL